MAARAVEDDTEEIEIVDPAPALRPPDKFARPQQPRIAPVVVDELQLYLDGTLPEKPDELPLSFWKRTQRVRLSTFSSSLFLALIFFPQQFSSLAAAARDVLGMPSSSTSVERLFSGVGNVTQPHLGVLSSTVVAKQTSFKVWVRVSDSEL